MDLQGKYRKTERIGRMNSRVQLHYATETVNQYGERIEAWASAGTFWAALDYLPLRSKEGEMAGQETVQQEVNITIRKRALIDENWRAYTSGRLYDIVRISESNDAAYMVLGCKQIQAATLSTPEGGMPVSVSNAYTETFTGISSDRVTVTVHGGSIPTDKAFVFVFLNRQYITQYTISGDEIIFDGFTIDTFDTVTVTFFA